jgi:hypothetical protein
MLHVWGRGEVYTGFWWEHVTRVGERRAVYRVLVGKPEGMRRLVKPRHIWKDNIETNLHEVGWRGMDWSGLRGTCEWVM